MYFDLIFLSLFPPCLPLPILGVPGVALVLLVADSINLATQEKRRREKKANRALIDGNCLLHVKEGRNHLLPYRVIGR